MNADIKSPSAGSLPARFAPDNHLLFRLAAALETARQAERSGGRWTEDFAVFVDSALAEYERHDLTPSEPIFILRGRDSLAAETVMHWIGKASAAGVDVRKLKSAMAIASEMAARPGRRLPD
jgi:hypothetical protein